MANRGIAECPDCQSVTEINMCLLTTKGQLVFFALCSTCAKRGDERSIRFFVTIEPDMFNYLIKIKFPLVEIKVVEEEP